MGPTASGKTALAEALADRTGARLVNADAFCVYRGLDIGTAKPARRAEYALMDIRDPGEEFGVGEWVRLALEELEGLYARGRSAIVVGGTGLYVRALFEQWSALQGPPDPALRRALLERERQEGLAPLVEDLRRVDPEAARRIDLRNPVRVRRALERALGPSEAIPVRLPPFRRLKVALHVPPAELRERILARLERQWQEGWVEEVKCLLERGVRPTDPGIRAIGYRTIMRYLAGDIGSEQARAEIATATWRYAKRQRTWLRSEPWLIWVQGGAEEDRRIDEVLERLHHRI